MNRLVVLQRLVNLVGFTPVQNLPTQAATLRWCSTSTRRRRIHADRGRSEWPEDARQWLGSIKSPPHSTLLKNRLVHRAWPGHWSHSEYIRAGLRRLGQDRHVSNHASKPRVISPLWLELERSSRSVVRIGGPRKNSAYLMERCQGFLDASKVEAPSTSTR